MEQHKRILTGWHWVLMALSSTAILLCLIMIWHHFSGAGMVGCDGGSSCDKILASRWSTVAGVVPVGGLALGAYLVLFVALFYSGFKSKPSIRRLSWSVMLMVSGAILASALWFTVLQKWIIGEFCIYCMSVHSIGILVSILVFWKASKGVDDLNGRFMKRVSLVGFPLVGVILAVMLVMLQILIKPNSVTPHEEIQIREPQLGPQLEAVPTIGPVDAAYPVMLLFDYQCSHCQQLHFILQEVVRRYEGKLAFILCPTPLEPGCNPYVPPENNAFEHSCELAKLAMAVWLADREAFVEFENWMFSYDSGSRWKPRTLEAAKAKASAFVGAQALESAMADPWIDHHTKIGIELFGKTSVNGKGAIPKLIYENRWMIPVPNVHTADDLMSVLQNSLGVPEP